jgi:hypothetical protein
LGRLAACATYAASAAQNTQQITKAMKMVSVAKFGQSEVNKLVL